MPLNAPGLQDDLESEFADPPATHPECAQAWADAVGSYASSVVPASTLVTAAKATLATALAAAFSGVDAASTAASMESAFTAFATTVGGGMAPAFVAIPPPAPVGFAALFAPPFPVTHAAAAAGYASAIDTWMRTATATPSGGGAPVPWN